jgi:hypothetical protein
MRPGEGLELVATIPLSRREIRQRQLCRLYILGVMRSGACIPTQSFQVLPNFLIVS